MKGERKRWFLFLFTLHSSLFTLLSCHREEKSPAACPVIIISVDTLRADHLPVYGYRGVETPAIDSFRADSLLFQNAYSHCPLTLPSHLSLLTGRIPPEHHVRNNIGFVFDSSAVPSLPTLLKARGYATGGAVSSYVLRSETGLSRAFDFYDDDIPVSVEATSFVHHQRPGNVTSKSALAWIEKEKSQPFFLFFHLYEPHAPYDPPEPFKSRYQNAYDGEIATADQIIGEFLTHLKALGIYDRSLIVFVSDHGEGFYDHGEDQHGILLYREAIHVPLIVKLPGETRRGETVSAPAQLIDVMPTVLEVTETAAPEGLRGSSLLSLKTKNRSIYSETFFPLINLGWSAIRSLTDDRYQYLESSRSELYDLKRDSAERKDVVAEERRAAAGLRSELAKIPATLEKMSQVDPEAAANLAALGYIGSAQDRESTAGRSNPADQVKYLPRIKEAFQLADEKKYAEAEQILRALLRDNPKMLDLWDKLGEVLTDAGQHKEAIEAYEEGIRQVPEFSYGLSLSLGFVYLQTGEVDKAASYAKLGLKMNGPKAHELLTRIALARGDLASAGEEARRTVGDREPQPSAMLLLAEVQQRQGRFQEAMNTIEAAERRAFEMHMGSVYRLDFLRGDILARLEKEQEAEQAYQREIQRYPSELQAYGNLAILYF
ncbi:MAG TPA: sulfatase-like hydrolase/transferase, partial [Thermoanaerobaculia bacterium]|nr:sulfatase-like hydrolase/transferase [Thermoanaerobaculia bacterium]